MNDRGLNLPTGPAAAAFIAAGIGCLAMGVVTVLCEASPPLKQALNLYTPAGPLTGKVLSTVVVWVVAWTGLHVAWRNRNVALGSAVIVTLVLVALAFVATFPPVFQLAEG
jgi:hypothetical protein